MSSKNYRNPDILKTLYWKNGLSLRELARKLNTTPSIVLFWMRRNKIPTRIPTHPQKERHKISRESLEFLYLKKRMSTIQIAKKLGVKSDNTIRSKLAKYGIPLRTRSESKIKHKKKGFSGNLAEKAYMLGLRAGDITAWINSNHIRVSTTTTHRSMVKLMKNIFGKYTHVHVYDNRKRWAVYSDLNSSFRFLLIKPRKIPSWILKSNKFFHSFLAGYVDCEGCWYIGRNRNCVIFTFKLPSQDKLILKQIRDKLIDKDFRVYFSLSMKRGTKLSKWKLNRDFYSLVIYRKMDVISLAGKLLPLSNHIEKIWKIRLILNNRNKNWNEIEKKLSITKRKIKEQTFM